LGEAAGDHDIRLRVVDGAVDEEIAEAEGEAFVLPAGEPQARLPAQLRHQQRVVLGDRLLEE
jgi:hypothetical protein